MQLSELKVGDKLTKPKWSQSEFITVTGVGETKFFGRPSWMPTNEDTYSSLTDFIRHQETPVKPDWVDSAWVNIYPRAADALLRYSTDDADEKAGEARIGRVHVGTGRWVPCRGKTVLQ